MQSSAPTLVIVSGAPGSGKTTLAHRLAADLRLPLISKDELKEALADAIGLPPDVPASMGLGAVAYALLAWSDPGLIQCTAAPEVVLRRYAERHDRGDRHAAHLDADRAAALADDLSAGRFEPLDLPIPTLVVDTTNRWRPAYEVVLDFAALPRASLFS